MGRIGSEGDEWRRLHRKGMSCVGSDGKEMGWEGLGRRGDELRRVGFERNELGRIGLERNELRRIGSERD